VAQRQHTLFILLIGKPVINLLFVIIEICFAIGVTAKTLRANFDLKLLFMKEGVDLG